jgi:glycosyltransferase involved in cell wall biosynthesis
MADSIAPTAVMCFSSGNGGMERSAIRLADLLSHVTETTLLCKKVSFIENLYRQSEYAFDCEAVKFCSRTFSPAMLVQVRSVIRKRKLGNIIFFGASELKTLYFAFLGFDLNVVVWHGTTKSRPKHDFFHRLVYSSVNYHVALSEHLIRNVSSIVPRGKNTEYRVIYPSFRIDAGAPGPEAIVIHKPLKLVHIGRIAAGKGQVDAVQACESLYQAGIAFEFDLVGPPGDEKYSRQLNNAIEHAPYSESIHLRGFVDDPAAFLEQADMLLFPSYGEGMPNAFIEALHYGIPCLAYSNTVFPEYLEMGFKVRLVRDRDVDALAQELLKMAQNLQSEKQQAASNRNLAVEYFNVSREIDGWREILL